MPAFSFQQLTERVAPASTALVIVDLQNEFCDPNGLCAKSGDDISAISPVVENVKRLVEEARRAGVFIIYVQSSYDSPFLNAPLAEGRYSRRGAAGMCFEGSFGHQFVPGISPAASDNEAVLIKHRYSAFEGTRLDLLLRANGIETLVMTGVTTEMCVESTLRDGFIRNYRIIMVADCVAAFLPDRDVASRELVARLFGNVVSLADLIQAWSSASSADRPRSNRRPPKQVAAADKDRFGQTALLLVDLQNDFCHERGAVAANGATISAIKATMPRIRGLLGWARESGLKVIHVKTENHHLTWNVGSPRLFARSSDGSSVSCISAAEFSTRGEAPNNDVGKLCKPNTWGAQLIDDLAPGAKEVLVIKRRHSAFADTSLELQLRTAGIRSVIIAGVMTHGAIDSTVRDASSRDFDVTLVEDCVAAEDRHADLHVASLKTLRSHFARVIPAATVTRLSQSIEAALR
jgi:ureidoacrylate peracid hydrolase